MNRKLTITEDAAQADPGRCGPTDRNSGHQFEHSTQSVYSQLRESILSGKIAPERKLATEALVAEFGLSRTPIRSALAVLASQGLVKYLPNRGYYSIRFSLTEIIAGVEIRARIFGYAAETCSRMPDRDALVETLSELLDANFAIAAQGGGWNTEREGLWHVNYYEFHRAIRYAVDFESLSIAVRSTMMLPFSGDPVRLSPSLRDLVRPECLEFQATVPDYVPTLNLLLRQTVDHIAAGQAARAGAMMQESGLHWADRIRTSLKAS